MARVKIVKRKVTFKNKNKVANCPICGKFYNIKSQEVTYGKKKHKINFAMSLLRYFRIFIRNCQPNRGRIKSYKGSRY